MDKSRRFKVMDLVMVHNFSHFLAIDLESFCLRKVIKQPLLSWKSC